MVVRSSGSERAARGALAVAVVLVAACSGGRSDGAPRLAGEDSPPPPAEEPGSPPSEAPTVEAELEVERVSPGWDGEGEPPEEPVSLVAGDRRVLIGRYQGCNPGGAARAPEGATVLDAMQCWYAGSGAAITLYVDGDDLVVTVLEQDEQVEEGEPVEAARIPLVAPPGGGAGGALPAQRMRGPFASPAALCAGWASTIEGGARGPCEAMDRERYSGSTPAAGAPFRGVSLLERTVEYGVSCALVVETERGRYLHPLGECEMEGSGEDRTEYADLRVEHGRVTLRISTRMMHEVEGGSESEARLVCGALADPSALWCARVVTRHTRYGPMREDGRDDVRGAFQRDVGIDARGRVVLGEPTTSGTPELEGQPAAGSYALAPGR